MINRYACLVAEPKTNTFDTTREVVGVVDVTVLRDDSVLQHLPGAEEYLYVSGIAFGFYGTFYPVIWSD